jgi:putative molybdopterin biosynthesis protein
MAEYLTTREVASYLRLNEKKVYDLVARGELPAARISGKWLFPKHLIDAWVEHCSIYPAAGLMGAVLDEMMIVQGSDDWLFTRAAEQYQTCRGVPVVASRIGSLAGLAALGAGKAHLAGCHVENKQVEKLAGTSQGCYLVTLFSRRQGLIFDRARHPGIAGLESLAGKALRFAERQALSGTYHLVGRLLAQAGIPADGFTRVGPFPSHLELALAIRTGQADIGVGTQLAAELCDLDFAALHTEVFKLAVPVAFASHPRMAGFLEFVLDELQKEALRGASGYQFEGLGRLETVGCAGLEPKQK